VEFQWLSVLRFIGAFDNKQLLSHQIGAWHVELGIISLAF